MAYHTRNRSNRREYFLYFLFLSTAVIVVAAGFYFSFSLKALGETGIRNREQSLSLMQNTFENLISQIDNSVALSQSYLQQYRMYFEQGKYSVLLQLHEELRSVSLINHINGVCVYYRDWEYTVSSELGLAALGYHPDALFLESLDQTGFRYRKTFFREKPLRDGEAAAVLTVVRSIPVYYATELPDAWIVIDIDLESLNALMENIFQVEDSFFSITAADGMPMVTLGSASMKEVLDRNINSIRIKNSSAGIIRAEDSGHMILYIPPGEQGLSFVYIEPYSFIIKDWFGRFFISAIGATALVLFAGVVGSFIFSKRIFVPIKAIFEKTNISGEGTEWQKETDLILQKIDELIEYNDRLEREKCGAEKNEIPYPVSIENEIYRTFRNGDMENLVNAVAAFRDYYAERAETERIQSAYLRLFCASEIFINGGFSLGNDNPDYRSIFTFTSIDEIHSWITARFTEAFYILHAHNRTQNHLLRDICRYIDANLEKDITAKGLWKQFDYHPSSLRRLFREEFNLTLKKYVDSKRIEKARELLLTTNLKIQEIAIEVGYVHTQSFIAFFQQAVNCTPAEFRRRNI